LKRALLIEEKPLTSHRIQRIKLPTLNSQTLSSFLLIFGFSTLGTECLESAELWLCLQACARECCGGGSDARGAREEAKN